VSPLVAHLLRALRDMPMLVKNNGENGNCGTCGEPIRPDAMTGTTCACAARARSYGQFLAVSRDESDLICKASETAYGEGQEWPCGLIRRIAEKWPDLVPDYLLTAAMGA
jgi:hypothetical protein